MNQGIIYLIFNKETGQKYVGKSTLSINKAWRNHLSEASSKSIEPIHQALSQYSVDKFSIKVIDECRENLLDKKERFWIETHKSSIAYGGYNTNIFPEIPVNLTKKILNKKNSNLEVEKEERKEWGIMLPENRGNGKHMGRKVMGINIETGEEKIWDSCRSAALEITGDADNGTIIARSYRVGTKCYGYRWRKLDHSPASIAVKGVHKKTWQKVYFPSINSACRAMNGTHTSGIRRSLHNPHKYTWKKYYWFYQ